MFIDARTIRKARIHAALTTHFLFNMASEYLPQIPARKYSRTGIAAAVVSISLLLNASAQQKPETVTQPTPMVDLAEPLEAEIPAFQIPIRLVEPKPITYTVINAGSVPDEIVDDIASPPVEIVRHTEPEIKIIETPVFKADPNLPRHGVPLPKVVPYIGQAKAGAIVINSNPRAPRLYFIVGNGTAIEYPIAVGKQGRASPRGKEIVSRMRERPNWTPTPRMVAENPRLKPLAGGHPKNPLGSHAIYLGSTEYRIHGTIIRTSIGKAESSGCFRMFNEDVADLYERVKAAIGIGTEVTMINAAQTPGIDPIPNKIALRGPL